MFTQFWNWYERNYALNLRIAAGVFLLQIVHLVWLTTDVALVRLFETSQLFSDVAWFNRLIVLVDYLEIPTLISVSLVYLASLRRQWNKKDLLYLFLLNTQWIHIFWITDEFVVDVFGGAAAWPVWLAWGAILIDYLEIPVMIETIQRVVSIGWKGFDEGQEPEVAA